MDSLLQDLCTKLFSGKKEHQRDLASIGLKTVVAEVSGGQLAKAVVKRVTPHLISGIKTQVSLQEFVANLMHCRDGAWTKDISCHVAWQHAQSWPSR